MTIYFLRDFKGQVPRKKRKREKNPICFHITQSWPDQTRFLVLDSYRMPNNKFCAVNIFIRLLCTGSLLRAKNANNFMKNLGGKLQNSQKQTKSWSIYLIFSENRIHQNNGPNRGFWVPQIKKIARNTILHKF